MKDINKITKEIIKKIVTEDLGSKINIEDINDSTNLIELGFHSLLSIKLIATIEGMLDIDLDDYDLDKNTLLKYSNLKDIVCDAYNKSVE
ncbi:acyl carrier protein [Clostridiaceae bacterium M8S5]|nr:acyl carrier protein [Clostridiaceae bacterium M8S5]